MNSYPPTTDHNETFAANDGTAAPQQAEANPAALLKSVFGYSSFRPHQAEIIADVLAGCDCLAVLPTGGGKSLCYQLPALLLQGPVLVVSPLIALMQDQVAGLESAGVAALFLNSSLGAEERRLAERKVLDGQVRLVYAAPESLSGDRVTSLFEELPPALVVVDEAHCVSEWGHDFRPDYRQLSQLRRLWPQASWLALTATATAAVRNDIVQALKLRSPALHLGGFERPNLHIRVQAKDKAKQQVLRIVQKQRGQSGIVYCLSRQRSEDMADMLQAAGIPAAAYHAGLSAEERSRNQKAFVRDQVDVICATVAFGMGIDKPDVRFVIHVDLPKSLENYYQEIGRAGRDGLDAECVLLYGGGDYINIMRMLEDQPDTLRNQALDRLDAMRRYAESQECRRSIILRYFDEPVSEPECGTCDNCLQGPQEQVDCAIPALKFLSCVKRSGEKFGAGHIIDILVGADTEKIRRFGHQRLSTYGIGGEFSKAAWGALARQLISSGHLVREPEHSVLLLGRPAYELFSSRAAYLVPASLFPQAAGRERGTSSQGGYAGSAAARGGKQNSSLGMDGGWGGTASAAADDDVGAAELFQKLRSLRKTLAEDRKVPPYVIFPDRTLKEMAIQKPVSLE
ncbi:MAG: ATP-dependent DNA helicase, partial [Spirochaetes bacterium]|nr:ATP-dependent DNA helicase [Spirochaetota bacterium]